MAAWGGTYLWETGLDPLHLFMHNLGYMLFSFGVKSLSVKVSKTILQSTIFLIFPILKDESITCVMQCINSSPQSFKQSCNRSHVQRNLGRNIVVSQRLVYHRSVTCTWTNKTVCSAQNMTFHGLGMSHCIWLTKWDMTWHSNSFFTGESSKQTPDLFL